MAAREGLTFELITTTEDGWPHVALLSVGEIVATGSRELRVALWTGTTTTRNLTLNGRATLMVIQGAAAYYMHLSIRRQSDLVLPHGKRAFFVASVEETLEDVVSYAVLTSGVAFELNEPAQTVAMWEETVEAMRAAQIV